MKLSILDLSPLVSQRGTPEALHNTIELARHVDRLGYTRYWLAEHHNMPGIASVAPEILIGPVAAATENLRVGAGGIMLPNHSPLKVAETFKLLAALYPGRIDLGLGRAPGTDGRTAQALRRTSFGMGADDFPEQLAELRQFDQGTFPAGHPFQSVRAVPVDVPLPPIWLLGSSDFSAQQAAQEGLPFAFAHHIAPQSAAAAMRLYRSAFTAQNGRTPYSILTMSVVCAATQTAAERLARCVDLGWIRFLRKQSGPLPTLEEAEAYRFSGDELEVIRDRRKSVLVGTPDVVKSRILELALPLQADEVMVTMMLPQTARLEAATLLAEAFALHSRSGPAIVSKC